MYFDGSLMKKGAGTGLVFALPLGVRMRYKVRLHFPSSNNVAEYEALINGLRIAIVLASDTSTSEATPSWLATKS